ncbi:NAD-dependent epimerase/dehydratase family protein [Pararhodospirillum photometricum]|uniref:NAD-dependent epimerase/dehydratase n=1 Tax=Pararhodospirillum photometricum DSM 122 TaxID=1150469 RepID=H6SSC0_PARPM|nr:NAD(P)-dependent oxidoreductase [Pararhodospirillum photometricum]CCG07799.1 NAD-dependent epimerase/dehydratase [Pararhodospirillum photometricum DSM 122]
MRFTILGATGLIGGHLVATLSAQGHSVAVPPRDADPATFEDPGHIIYAIGLTADFRQRPFDTVDAHVTRLAQVLRRCPFESLLYLSSTRVYSRTSCTLEDTPLPVAPHSPGDLYQISKLMGESLCLHGGRANVRIARLSNVVAPDTIPRDTFVSALAQAAEKGHIYLESALSSVKDYITLADVGALLPRIAVGGRERIYNVASGVQTSHRQWIDHFVATTGCTWEVAPQALETSFPPIDITRLRQEFAFTPSSVF